MDTPYYTRVFLTEVDTRLAIQLWFTAYAMKHMEWFLATDTFIRISTDCRLYCRTEKGTDYSIRVVLATLFYAKK